MFVYVCMCVFALLELLLLLSIFIMHGIKFAVIKIMSIPRLPLPRCQRFIIIRFENQLQREQETMHTVV